MVFSSRLMALIIATCIAIVTISFLSIFEGISNLALLVTAMVSFSSAYLLIYILLDFLIFREINKVYNLLNKLRKKDINLSDDTKPNVLNPFKHINEEITYYVSLKQREIDELKKLEAFRKEFIADVSHELKTPIFAAQGFLHTLLDGAIKDKNVRTRFLRKAAKSLDGLDILVQDLLTLSHIETGEIKMHFDTFDMIPLVEEVFDQFEEKADKKQIKLRFDKRRTKPVLVYADPKRIMQVMNNLISNALKYGGENNEVIIGFEVDKKQVSVSVIDFGEGIPPDDLKRIFERFYRVDKSRSRERGGTGLGLAIVKHILEGHNTKVSVTSAIGKGSTFSFRLPRVRLERLDEEVQSKEEHVTH